MNPHHHRSQRPAGDWLWCPDVEREAVFALRPVEIAHDMREARGELRRDRAIHSGVARSVPNWCWMGRLEAQDPDRWCRIRDAPKYADAILARAAQRPHRRANDRILRPCSHGRVYSSIRCSLAALGPRRRTSYLPIADYPSLREWLSAETDNPATSAVLRLVRPALP